MVGPTIARVTWRSPEGAECQSQGVVLDVNREWVVLSGQPKIPRAAVRQIASQGRVPRAGRIGSSTGTRPTASTSSVVPAGTALAREVAITLARGALAVFPVSVTTVLIATHAYSWATCSSGVVGCVWWLNVGRASRQAGIGWALIYGAGSMIGMALGLGLGAWLVTR